MAVSGFEGFEKRLELHFYCNDPMALDPLGLRRLDFLFLQQVLDAVQCSVVSAVGNSYFDAYVLSESSLFVYPTKIIIKTCGTTHLLKSIPCLLGHAFELGLTVCGCRKACILPSKTSHSWHVYTASDHQHMVAHLRNNIFTMEVCMTQLDSALARRFFIGGGNSGDIAGKEMTALTGIGDINPGALICDFGFDPCGYSMNGIDGAHYSTIHVTPEDGYSYASFECVGFLGEDSIGEVLKKVARVFRPGTVSVSVCTCQNAAVVADFCTRVAGALKPLGFESRSRRVEEFPAAGSVTFQTFTARRK